MSRRPKITGIDITFVSAENRLVWFFRPERDGEVDRDPRNHQQPTVASVLRAQRAQIALMQRMEVNR
jgi:hypothetical protein